MTGRNEIIHKLQLPVNSIIAAILYSASSPSSFKLEFANETLEAASLYENFIRSSQ